MSIEAALADLAAAVRANTECLQTSLSQVTFKPAAETPIKPARAKPAPVAAPAAAPVVAAAPVQPAAPAPAARAATADTSAPVNPGQIKAAGDDLSILAELDRATAVGVLAEFGVQKMTAMPQTSIPEFHAKVKAAIARLSPAAQTPSLI
jgi:hypothetical protein